MAESKDILGQTVTSAEENLTITTLLGSETFQKAPALRALLKYLWEHRDEELNEFRIAVDALGKRPDFNPKTDSTVRVQILRVRQKLKEYYEKEGKGTQVRIILPTGGHRLHLEETSPPDVSPPRSVSSGLPWILAAFFAVISAVALFGVRKDIVSSRDTPTLSEFWRSFTANGKPVRVILPNVAFFRWPRNTIKIRDTRVNGFQDIDASPELRSFVQQWGQPELMVNYTSAPDAYAAGELVAYLSRAGVDASVVGHREAALDQTGTYNRILLGNYNSSPHILPLLKDLNFEPTTGFSFRNRTPMAGEPAIFPMVIESRRRETVPGLICRLRQDNADTLILLSENSSSLARLLTTDSGLAVFEKVIGKDGVSGPFELLSVAEIEGGRVVKTEPKAFRLIAVNH